MNHRHGIAAALAAVASLGLAGCGGASGTPGVANLRGSNAAATGTTTTVPHGSPTQLLDEFASCMRQNGYPNMADPYVDSNGTIHVSIPATGNGDTGLFSMKDSPCSSYLTAASTALDGGKPPEKPDYSKLLKFARCMRTHGVADFPDPQSGGGLSIRTSPGSDLNPDSPTFQSASKTCSKSAGMPAFGTGGQRGGIEVTQGGGPGPGPAGKPDTAGGGFGIQAGS